MMIIITIIVIKILTIESVAYSSRGSHIGRLDFCNCNNNNDDNNNNNNNNNNNKKRKKKKKTLYVTTVLENEDKFEIESDKIKNLMN